MSEAPNLTPEPVAEPIPDRREQLAAALDAVEAAQGAEPVGDPAPLGDTLTRENVQEDPAKLAPPEGIVEEPLWKRPPASWKKDYHESWASADDKFKEYAWQREEEMRKGIEPLLPKAQFADRMNKAIEPYVQTMRGLGVEPEAAVATLMQADHLLRTLPPDQKRNYLAQLAAQYGVNLGEVSPLDPDAPVDPRLYALQNDLNNTKGMVLSWQQQQQATENQRFQAEIERVSQGKEHFEALRPQMVQLLQSGLAESYEDAYEKALRLDDTLFRQTQAASQAKADTDRREAADKAAKAAKAAAVSVRSSTPGAQTPAKAQDRRSVIAEQFDALSERF